MTDIVAATPQALAEAVAGMMATTLAALPGRLAISLSGGSTPKLLYETLARPPYLDRMPWDRIHWFWGDERFVPATDALSNARMIHDAMLGQVPAPPGNIHPVPTEGLTPDQAAAQYEATLKAFKRPGTPLFDLVLMGLGTNGHTASLFPGDPALADRASWARAVTPPGEPTRITLTWPPLENCRHGLFLVTGADKQPVAAPRPRA